MTPTELALKLSAAKLIALDCETNGLDWRQHHIVGYVITFAVGDSHYFPFRHESGNGPDVTGLIREALKTPSLTAIFHNAQFDLNFFHKEGVTIAGPVHDTMVMAALCNEHSPSFSLEKLCQEWQTGSKKLVSLYDYMAKYFLQPKTKNLMSLFHCLPGDDPMVQQYATLDGDATLELYFRLSSEIEKQKLTRVWAVESKLTKILHDISWRGMRIDEDRLAFIQKEALRRHNAALKDLPENLNSRSPLQMEKLFSDHNIINWPLTATGRPSFPETWLLKSELGKKVVAVRKWSHLLSTFIDPIISDHVYKGRLHTNFNQLKADEYGTVSGRLSANNPNVFNFPSPKRNKETAELFRQIFISDQGLTLVEQDMDQQEVRIAAHFAKVEVWLKGYNQLNPIDAHSAVAEATGLSRQNAKTINLGLIYGLGRKGLKEKLGVDDIEGDIILKKFDQWLPEIRQFSRYAANLWKDRGYIRSLLGRKFRLQGDDPAFMAFNRIVQGSAADICKLSLVKLAEIDQIQILNSIYDSVIYQREHPMLDDLVRAIMCKHDEFSLRVPLTTSIVNGNRWSELTNP